MAADRESSMESLGYVRDNSTNAAPIDDDVAPAGARVDTAEMADRSTTKTHKIHRGHRPREIIAAHPWAAPPRECAPCGARAAGASFEQDS